MATPIQDTSFAPRTGYNTAGNPLHPGIAERFSQESYDARGITNPQVERASVRTNGSQTTNRQYIPKVPSREQLRTSANRAVSSTKQAAKEFDRWQNRSQKALKIAHKSITSGKVIGKVEARFQVGLAFTYTGFLNFLASFFGILSAIFLGAVGAIASLPEPVAVVADAAIAAVTIIMGYEIATLWVLFAMFWMFQIIFVISMFALAMLHLRTAGIKTTSGDMTGFKVFALGISIAISCLPGLPLFIPWIWSWLFVLVVYPD